MRQRLAILCPGQGAQNAQLFDLANSDARVASLLAQWPVEAACGVSLPAALTDPALLFANRIAQPLIVASALAVWEALKSSVPAPALVAGYSIGELSAYGIAGALPAAELITLAATRARAMDACTQSSDRQSLLAVSGLTASAVQALLEQHWLAIAIQNGDDNLIIGGLSDDLHAAEIGLQQLGAQLTPIQVEVASHTVLMQDAVAPFREALRQSTFASFTMPVLAGISAVQVSDKEAAVSHLSRQIAETIRWDHCMDACAEAGITVALELGPGGALSRMLRARHPSIECRSVVDFRTLAGIVKWLERQCH
ncbi:ACP S-malonyltransferase [Actimicrobium sp. CCI2.3]|uniref:ACP S-malonyltransferase n=1 Tax=Actimicrobium sp. CCI2.3 TaxID=3048616 RepID=UPI002AB5A311|nr:acyltransferase domain-containing protein [Actimicrobium sp. CCI2.3]MDY7574864.1 acyltransferase domain-containing protein [Actimicrobium sp. CCI2.3]MEB0020175.1 acyltransferase domain-containing protein [Actimicrobium sp. CCI2.3]